MARFDKLVEAAPQSERSKEFLEGYEASSKGIVRNRNPYHTGVLSGHDWDDGWTTHFHGEPK